MQVLPRLKEYKGAEGKFIFPVGTTKIEIDIVENGCFVNAFLGVYNDYFRVTGTKLSLEEGKALIKASKISSDKK